MAQKQIYRNGNRLGFLPWGTPGRRLGAARWTHLFSEVAFSSPVQITLASTGNHQISEIPSLFRNNTTYSLPKITIGVHFTISQRITWRIDVGDSESRLLGGQLSVIGSEGSKFILSAEVNGVDVRSFQCQIQEKEEVFLRPIIVEVRPTTDSWPREKGRCEFTCNSRQWFSRQFDTDLESVELGIGKGIHIPTSINLNTANRMMYFGSLFNIHLRDFPLNSDERGEIKWYTGDQVFIAEVIFDYTRLSLDSIASTGHFIPEKIQLLELYDGEISEAIIDLDLCLGETELHGWPVSLTITTPTDSAKIEGINNNNLTYQIKREKIQKWFESPPINEHQRKITLTPNIAGQELPGLASTAQLHLDISEMPHLGYCGNRAEEWIKFLLRSQEEYHTIQQQHEIVNLFADQDWSDEISPEKLSSIKRNNIYRIICKPPVDPPVTNSEQVDKLLSNAYKCLDDKVDTPRKWVLELSDLYGGDDKVIDVASTDLQVLYPRQKFKLSVNGSLISGDGPHNGRSFDQQGESIAVLNNSGTFFKPQRGDTGFDFDRLPEAFAYKTNTQTFAAPQTSGVYYLYVPSKGDHYIVEIEVRGFIDEVIE